MLIPPLVLLVFGCASEPTTPDVIPAPEPAPDVSIAPAWTVDACPVPAPDLVWAAVDSEALRHVRTVIPDLDGDGQPESFDSRQLARDGHVEFTLVLQPTAGDPIGVEAIIDFRNAIHDVAIPEALRGPDRAEWRRPFEHELLLHRCDTPDPSVAWLDAPALRWFAGPPVMPGVYGLYEPDQHRWRIVGGQIHTMSREVDYPLEDDLDGEVALLRTAHGILLHDRGRKAHAWLFVTKRGSRTLKRPSIGPARFDGDLVVIEPASDLGVAALPVWIDRLSGQILDAEAPGSAPPR